MKACCGFGHRNICENISNRIDSVLGESIQQGCEMLYTGDNKRFSSAVRKIKKTYPYINLVCVKPYFTQELNENKSYYESMYDDVIIPTEIIGVHFKAAIQVRNQWMIDHSDTVLIYMIRNQGGAYKAKKYAEKQKKHIVPI